jgi:hypothetical protein
MAYKLAKEANAIECHQIRHRQGGEKEAKKMKHGRYIWPGIGLVICLEALQPKVQNREITSGHWDWSRP